ncbi:unnamed protein product [Withania somnifera]
MPASFPQYVTEAITGPLPDPPGVKLQKEGLKAKHPVVFIPGIVTCGLELWEGHQCAEGLFRKRLWGGTFGEVYKRPLCWVDHMTLDNETGMDPPGIRVRPVSGLVAADYFAPGYFVWAVLIANLARIGYEEKTMYMAAYDWRLSFREHRGVLDTDIFHFQTLEYIMKMSRTWDATMSMIPRGGDTIWGGLDWSPGEGYSPCKNKLKDAAAQISGQQENRTTDSKAKYYSYGRMISFGKDAAEADPSDLKRIDFRGAVKGSNVANNTCDVWNEYQEMGVSGTKAVEEYKVYTAGEIVDLLNFVAPKMMTRGSAHFSYGIADDLDDPKYSHYKYWSNPLETKLPNAPDMEIYSMYGVGIETERAYVYKRIPTAGCNIPFQIDTSADDEDEDSCLKAGVYTVDGDETVPALSAGFMCAKGWRGRTRFNPSGIKTHIREYYHAPPANLLEGRGTQSGAHVDIMGNFALIEDIMRVAAGGTSEDLGGDRVYSDIFKWSEKINLRL